VPVFFVSWAISTIFAGEGKEKFKADSDTGWKASYILGIKVHS
jgi:hypothetical protein